MTTTAFLAYLLIIGYFVVERSLRKGEQALSLQAGEADCNSSRIIWMSGLFSIFLVLLAPTLNAHGIGHWRNVYVGWLGLALMLGGLIIRHWAAKTLGKFYTRTLQIIEGQAIVEQAPYNLIRHPGYLGTFLMEIGAGLAVHNWIVLLVLIVIGVTSRAYRIYVEETLLKTTFGARYEAYSIKTWRLLPFVF
ncbi:MAG: isoprenylcysteine carboxylmethyltransferase family protein [Cyanobacteria bacterium P01_A01_bin.123]